MTFEELDELWDAAKAEASTATVVGAQTEEGA